MHNNVSTDNSTFVKYKTSFSGNSIVIGGDRVFKNVKIAAPLKYLSTLWWSLEIPVIV